jgi:hypothetical protein
MTLPAPADVLRHRGPALVVAAIEGFDGTTLRCRSAAEGPWRWPRVLEGAAQTAGLLVGLAAGGVSNRAVIAEYRDVAVGPRERPGPMHFAARVERRLLHFWRCRVEARAADGEVVLRCAVTLAPGRTS